MHHKKRPLNRILPFSGILIYFILLAYPRNDRDLHRSFSRKNRNTDSRAASNTGFPKLLAEILRREIRNLRLLCKIRLRVYINCNLHVLYDFLALFQLIFYSCKRILRSLYNSFLIISNIIRCLRPPSQTADCGTGVFRSSSRNSCRWFLYIRPCPQGRHISPCQPGSRLRGGSHSPRRAFP